MILTFISVTLALISLLIVYFLRLRCYLTLGLLSLIFVTQLIVLYSSGFARTANYNSAASTTSNKKASIDKEYKKGKTDNTVIVVGIEGSYYPWDYVDDNGNPQGYDVEVAREVAHRLGCRCKIELAPFVSLLTNLNRHQYQMVLASVSNTEARSKEVAFSSSYAQIKLIFLGLKRYKVAYDRAIGNKQEINNPALLIKSYKNLLRGKVIGVQSGTTYLTFLRTYFGSSVHVRSYASQTPLILDLSMGRIDFALVDTSSIANYLKEDPRLIQAGPLLPAKLFPDLLGRGIGIAIAKDNPELLKKVNKVLSNMKKDGMLKALAIKSFGTDLSV